MIEDRWILGYNLHAMRLLQQVRLLNMGARPNASPRPASTKPIPKVTPDDVQRIVRRDFSAGEYDTVMSMLSEYGTAKWHMESTRVQLAALKVANGSVQRLRTCIEETKSDYRDALSAAEYPACSKIGFRFQELPAEQRSRIIDSDWREYEEWLKR